MLKAVVDGSAKWDGDKAPVPGFELKFYYRTTDFHIWGCNHNDVGSTAMKMLKCIDETNHPVFKPVGESPNLEFDMVIQDTQQVNHYAVTVGKCSGGGKICPGEKRSFSGTVEVKVAGTSGTPVGKKAEVSGNLVDDYAPNMVTADSHHK